ncbi:hypothetical protein NECID01_0862 [Nematocida sp. AWRm77]|nr:hypothetical protein NECID01_0862 [Nematocida sp. AWRm77]
MEENRMHCRIMQAMVAEILHQIGFEKANKQALHVLMDLSMKCIERRLANIKLLVETAEREVHAKLDLLEVGEETQSLKLPKAGEAEGAESKESAEEERKAAERVLLSALIEECVGGTECYKREELVSFLTFQIGVAKQIKKEGEKEKDASLLEMLRIGDAQGPGMGAGEKQEKRFVDFTGEEEEEKKLEEKKYLDQDVREYLQAHLTLPLEKKVQSTLEVPEIASLDKSIVKINKKKKEFLIKENMRDYEYMLNRKRLTASYWTPCETASEIPLLSDLLILSTTRKVKKKRKEDAGKKDGIDTDTKTDAHEVPA